MAGNRVGYIRVSTFEQNTDRQLEGVQVDKAFTDKISGKDTNRPGLKSLLDYVREGDTVVVHSFDRLARNLDDLRKLVFDLVERGITVEFVKENLRYTNDPNDLYGKLILSVLGSFAEFERSLIRQRQLEGIEAAKKKGVYTGRKRALSPSEILDLQKKATAKKAVKSKIAREYGITRETLYQYLKLEVKNDGLAEEDALGLAMEGQMP